MVYTEEVQLKDGISGPAQSASAQLNVLQKALIGAQQKMTVANAMGNMKAYQSAAKDVTKLQSAIQTLPPANDSASSSFSGMKAQLAEFTGGASAVVDVVQKVVTSIGSVILAGAQMAIAANQANKEMVSMFNALGEGKVQGTAVVDMLTQLSSTIGMTREQLAPLAKEFMVMGITGTEQLKALTVAAASSEAITKGGADAFTKLFQQANAAASTGNKFVVPFKKLQTQLQATGLNIDDVAKAMGTTGAALSKGLQAGTVDAKKFASALTEAATSKGAGPLAAAASSLTNVWAKFMQDVNDSFKAAGPAVDSFLAAVKDMFTIFDSGTDSGKLMKASIGGFFKDLFTQATKVVPLVKHFMLDLVIGGLHAYIALKPIIGWFKQLQQNKQVMSTLTSLFDGLKVVMVAAAIVIGVVVLSFGVLAATMVAVTTVFWGLVGTIGSVVTKSLGALVDWGLGAATAAKDFIMGLVNGITGGVGDVVNATKGLADSAKNAFKAALGIHSPSKEMFKLGAFTGQGVAQGIDSTADQVGGSAQGLGSSAKSGASDGMSGSGSGGGGAKSITINVGGITIGGQGGEGGTPGPQQSPLELTEIAFATVIERIILTAGL